MAKKKAGSASAEEGIGLQGQINMGMRPIRVVQGRRQAQATRTLRRYAQRTLSWSDRVMQWIWMSSLPTSMGGGL